MTRDRIHGPLEGVVNIGNAGIDRKAKEAGGYCTLCTLVNDTWVDIDVTKKQLIDLKEKIESHLEVVPIKK